MEQRGYDPLCRALLLPVSTMTILATSQTLHRLQRPLRLRLPPHLNPQSRKHRHKVL